MIEGLRGLKGIILLIFILTISLLLIGCDNNSSSGINQVYKFSGAKGAGDFIDITINLSNNTYSYAIRAGKYEGESGSGTFHLVGTSGIGPYKMDSGNVSGEQFVMLDDEILLVSDNEATEGNQLITALKRSSINYADEIDQGSLSGEYHIATSLEGYVGTVTIPDGGNITVSFEGQTSLSLPYSYQDEYKALRLLEENTFRHYGVFTGDYKIGVFDSYEYVGSDWEGDGMAILVKKGTYSLSDYEGTYSYMDVDGSDSYMTFEIKEEGSIYYLYVEGESNPITDLSNDDENSDPNDGRIDFSADLVDDVAGEEDWHIFLLPDQMMVIASDTSRTFGGGDGGLGIGVKIN